MVKLLSDRLMALLRTEITAFEQSRRVPRNGVPNSRPTVEGISRVASVPAAKTAVAARGGTGSTRKDRIDALSQLTRTLEKLLDLKRLESLIGKGEEENDTETLRLRKELITRLKALDARRHSDRRLFGPSDGKHESQSEDAVIAGGGVPAGQAV